MAEVKWIKLKVGMFDGTSFKKIKRAKVDGVLYRDKLTAVWFELMDFAGKCNQGGAFIDKREIPYKSMDDIAIMIDRDPEELEKCMDFFIRDGMIEIIDDVYMLSNWEEYQSLDRLAEIREYNREAKRRSRAKKKLICNVTDMSMTCQRGHDIDKDKDKEEDKEDIPPFPPVDIVPQFGDALQAALDDWLEYKSERREPYKPVGMRNLIGQIRNSAERFGESAVADLIRKSIACGYRGITFEKLQPINHPAAQQSNRNIFLEMLEEERARTV